MALLQEDELRSPLVAALPTGGLSPLQVGQPAHGEGLSLGRLVCTRPAPPGNRYRRANTR